MPESSVRRIRTFHPRRSRTTPRAARALAELLPEFGVAVTAIPGDPAQLFDGTSQARMPVVLEIGPGMGAATLEMAAADPETGILAVDVHTPGVGALLAGLGEAGLDNVRVCVGDALEVMDRIEPGRLAGIRAFFPDPWPKQRHHKRRLVQPGFVAHAADLLVPGGLLHLATDIEDYAEQMLRTCLAEPRLANTASGYASRQRPVTKFELMGARAGRVSRDIVFRRLT